MSALTLVIAKERENNEVKESDFTLKKFALQPRLDDTILIQKTKNNGGIYVFFAWVVSYYAPT